MHTAIKITQKSEGSPEVEKIVVIPNTELLVLSLLGQGEMFAAQISRKSASKISTATVYTLCNRLIERGLLARKKVNIPFGELYITRKCYCPTYTKMEVLK